jgi:Rap1a immunity proteins
MVARGLVSAVILVFSFSRVIAGEADLNVQDLYRFCKAPERSAKSMLCLGYISGVGNMMQLIGVAEKQQADPILNPLALCGDISGRAMVLAFINWAQKNRPQWTQPQLAGVTLALSETWPCPSQ